jgi:mRNA interferase MazF
MKVESDILCEAIRSISKDRLVVRWGTVSPNLLETVADRLRILMRL